MVNLKVNYDEYIPLRDIVFKTLREAIITGDLKPGERLMEIKLANELGVSRTPVREAIRKLELEGLVIMTARKGAEVAPINEKDLREVLEIRKVLESLACELACKNVQPENVALFEEINAKTEEAVKNETIEEITKQDVAFHEAIYSITKNDRLVQMLHNLKEHIFRYRLEYIKDMKNKGTIVEEHKKIIDAIASKNVRAACKEIERHIEVQEKYILNTLIKEAK
ncbi:MAG: GntR family transcriptional regulator [Lachnospiraceae bacterium]|jgi:DNA-binding GntR family transcriptional regulator|nr:GntR family transcriptional regulator [Lachnospiraceae bacterium]MBR3360259.1 GntR family transcriptional regulator [Lachnospiraceae bacterium]MDO4206361.1 GntR family transcriptional regulator [Lachnospiraceae bacterium]